MRATPPTVLIMLILLKLHRCFGHDLKVSMWYGLSDYFLSLQFCRGRTGLVVRASDFGSGDPGSILGRVGVLFP